MNIIKTNKQRQEALDRISNRAGNTAIEWDAVKFEYVTNPQKPTMDTIAKLFAINPGLLRRRAAADGWVRARKRYFEQAEEAQIAHAAAVSGESRIDILETSSIAANILMYAIEQVGVEVHKKSFSIGLTKVSPDKLIEKLATAINALEKLMRVISLLRGGVDARAEVSLVDLLAREAEAQETAAAFKALTSKKK